MKLAKIGKFYDAATPQFTFHGEEKVVSVQVGPIHGVMKPVVGVQEQPAADDDQMSLEPDELDEDEMDDDDQISLEETEEA